MVVFPPKSNTRFQVIQFRKQLAQRQKIIIWPPKNRKPIGQRDLLASMKMIKISRESIPLQTRFTFQWSVEKDDTIMGKVVKGEGKTHGKNGKKPQNVLRSKTKDRQAAFKITIRGD